jgi:hypothetical protein
MIRKTIASFALAALLAAGLAFAASEPVTAPDQSAPAVQAAPEGQPVLPDLADLLDGGACGPQPTAVKPGCSKTCKADRDCPYYPEQVCAGGCCVF